MSEISPKEKLLLEYLLADKETFVKCYTMLKPEYFSPPNDRVVEFILDYFRKHYGIPDVDIIDAEVAVSLKERDPVDESERSYLIEEIEQHCQEAAMSIAVLEAADLISEGNTEDVISLIREAMLVKVDKSIGRELFENSKDRIEQMEDSVTEYSCGVKEIDNMLGYFRRGEFYMVYAVSGGGKSIFLGNAAAAFAKQGLDVSIITLELKEDLYCKRLDSMIVGTDLAEHKQKSDTIDEFYSTHGGEFGSIIVKKMPAKTTSSEIEAYLMEYHLTKGKYPDVLLVDYVGLMGVDGMRNNNNKFDIDHEKALGIIRMAETHNMITFSAGQINREGQDVLKVNPSHCAGGISLINDSDGAFALVASEEDLDNDQVQAQPLKIRHTKKSAGGITIYRDGSNMRMSGTAFTIKPAESPLTKRKEENKIQPEKKKSAKSKLRDAMKL